MASDRCHQKKRLSSEDLTKIYNLYGTDYLTGDMLTCGLSGNHERHLAHVVTQYIGDTIIPWWASWTTPTANQYSLFQAPFCGEDAEREGETESCTGISGHPGDHRHE